MAGLDASDVGQCRHVELVLQIAYAGGCPGVELHDACPCCQEEAIVAEPPRDVPHVQPHKGCHGLCLQREGKRVPLLRDVHLETGLGMAELRMSLPCSLCCLT